MFSEVQDIDCAFHVHHVLFLSYRAVDAVNQLVLEILSLFELYPLKKWSALRRLGVKPSKHTVLTLGSDRLTKRGDTVPHGIGCQTATGSPHSKPRPNTGHLRGDIFGMSLVSEAAMKSRTALVVLGGLPLPTP